MSVQTDSNVPKPNYVIHTADIPLSALAHRHHPIDNNNEWYTASLGDSTGLTNTAVHFCRLTPGATSTTLHWHSHEDEWMFIVDAGEGAVAIIWEGSEGDGEATQREETIRTGDFFGFKGGVQRAHAFRAGSKEMTYLVGGSSTRLDISYYPEHGKARVNDSQVGALCWAVEDKAVYKPSPRVPHTIAPQ